MDTAFRNILEVTKCSLSEAVRMTSTSAAQSIGLGGKKGDLQIGFDADITILDKDYTVIRTFVKGKTVYRKNL